MAPSTAKQAQAQPPQATKSFECHFCHTQFGSRNAVFRHLRTDGCTQDHPCSPCESKANDPIIKQSIAILFGYVNHHRHPDDANNNNQQELNESAGQQVCEAVQQALKRHDEKSKKAAISNDNDQKRVPKLLDFRIQESRTQCSVAKLRKSILQQDPECAAASDVLILTGTCLQSSLPQLEIALLDHLLQSDNTLIMDNEDRIEIRIWACKLLNSDLSVHAERSCTQITYHYLVPLAWMPDADLLLTKWGGWGTRPPTDSLKRFKVALRGAECGMVPRPSSSSKFKSTDKTKQPQQSTKDFAHKMASGRFGRLGAKERKAWHNFADPTLRGLAAPNQEMVWRVVDFCRMVGMANFGTKDAALVVEVRGDAFLLQQVRRIIGTAVAMAHGWIPLDAWDTALRNPAGILETVLAPPGRQYLAECRFHFEESLSSGKSLFESDTCGKVLSSLEPNNGNSTPHTWAQRALQCRSSSEGIRLAEDQWLQNVRDKVAPRVRQSMQNLLTTASSPLIDSCGPSLEPAPQVYMDVLTRLRDIVSTGQWPETSVARSSVLDKAEGHGKAGSFTVINTKLEDKLQNSSGESVELPLANQLFPDLAMAVFELEKRIAEQARKAEVAPDGQAVEISSEFSTRRPQSTHCAVNANAQFTPHVDSGRGAGQSLSIIVGLGDYHNGQLLVEGLPCDIRFKPLEFDGWSLRHWTNQYQGERFSLVWFTPELT